MTDPVSPAPDDDVPFDPAKVDVKETAKWLAWQLLLPDTQIPLRSRLDMMAAWSDYSMLKEIEPGELQGDLQKIVQKITKQTQIDREVEDYIVRIIVQMLGTHRQPDLGKLLGYMRGSDEDEYKRALIACETIADIAKINDTKHPNYALRDAAREITDSPQWLSLVDAQDEVLRQSREKVTEKLKGRAQAMLEKVGESLSVLDTEVNEGRIVEDAVDPGKRGKITKGTASRLFDACKALAAAKKFGLNVPEELPGRIDAIVAKVEEKVASAPQSFNPRFHAQVKQLRNNPTYIEPEKSDADYMDLAGLAGTIEENSTFRNNLRRDRSWDIRR